MTTVIDERVVEMRFNNADFEKNVAQSMDTLDKLKKSLNIDSAKSLENIGKASKNFSLSGMTETITQATTKFSALEIAGVTAIANITNKAMDFGIKFVKSLSIDQVSSGFTKYAQKTTAVQTIIAATHKSILEVESEMQKLNWFTDETSYNFVDMVNNIGKFTSNGVKLEAASGAMQGIATWAARSGQNAQAASRAMYNFSQALGSGAMMVKDWMSIEQANMATTEFKQTAIETAVELGKLKKTADGLYTTLDGKTTVSVNEFRDSLKKKWFDTDVIIATLNRYNQYAEELYALSEKTGRSATQLMIDADKYKEGTLDIESVAKSSKMSVTELAKAYESLNSETNKLSREAFKNAQEAKTFQEVMDATADAVSTSWMNTFQFIFGNYEEAKALWTGMANMLVDAFTESGTARNEVLSFWKNLGGRDSLIKGAVEALNLFIKPLQAVNGAFQSMFPDTVKMGGILKILTDRFHDLMLRLQPSERVLRDIYLIFKALFTIGKAVIDVFVALFKAVVPVTKPFGSLLELILDTLAVISAYTIAIINFIRENGLLKSAIEFVALAFSKFWDILKAGLVILGGTLFTALRTVVTLAIKAGSALFDFLKKLDPVSKAIKAVSTGIGKLTNFINGFKKATSSSNTVTKKMTENFAAANEAIAETGTITRNTTNEVKKSHTALSSVLKILKGAGTIIAGFTLAVVSGVKTIALNIFNFFKDFKTRFTEAKKNAKNFFDVIKIFFKTLFESFSVIGEQVSGFFEKLGVNTSEVKDTLSKVSSATLDFIRKIDTGKIAAIAMAAALLALVGSFVKVSDAIKSTFGAIGGVFNNINKILKKQFMKSSVITDLAKSFAIIAGSLALLTFVDQTKLRNVGDVMLSLMIAFTACAGALKILDNLLIKNTLKSKVGGVNTSIIALAGAFAVLAGVFAMLNEIQIKGNWKEWLGKLGIILAMMVEVTAAAVVLSKFAPKLTKGAVLILAVALSMKFLVDAIDKISNTPIDKLQGRLGEFAVLIVGVSTLIAATGRLNLRSALALILVAKAITMVWPELVEVGKVIKGTNFQPIADAAIYSIDSLKNFYHHLIDAFGDIWGNIVAIGMYAGLIVMASKVALILNAIGSMGKFLASIGIALAGIGLGMMLVAKALGEIAEIRKVYGSSFNDAKVALLELMAILGLIPVFAGFMQVISNVIGKKMLKWTDNLQTNFFALAATFISIGVASILLAKALEIISNNINGDKLAGATIALSALLLFLGIAAAGAGLIKKGMPVIVGLVAIITAVSVLLAEMVILGTLIKDPGELVGPWMAIISILGVLAIVLDKVSRIEVKQGLAVIGMISSFVLGLVGVAVALKIISTIKWTSLIKAMLLGVAPVMTALYIVMKALFKLAKEVSLPKVRTTAILLGSVVVAIISLCGVMYGLSRIKFSSLFKSLTFMSLIMAELLIMLIAVQKVSKSVTIANVRNIALLLATTIGSIIVMVTAIWAISKIPTKDLRKAIGAMVVIEACMVGLAALMGVIQVMVADATLGLGAYAFPALIASLGVAFVGFGLGLLAASAGMLVGAHALSILAPGLEAVLQVVQKYPNLQGQISLLSAAFVALGISLGVFGIGGVVGAAAIALLAGSLYLLQPAVENIVDDLNNLTKCDFVAISNGLIELAKAGIVLGLGAGGIKDYSLALDQLTDAIGNFNNGAANANPSPAKTVETLWEDIDGTIVTKTKVTSDYAYAAGEDIAISYESGVLSKEDDVKNATSDLSNSAYIGFNEAWEKRDEEYGYKKCINKFTDWLGGKAKQKVGEAASGLGEEIYSKAAPSVDNAMNNIIGNVTGKLNQLYSILGGMDNVNVSVSMSMSDLNNQYRLTGASLDKYTKAGKMANETYTKGNSKIEALTGTSKKYETQLDHINAAQAKNQKGLAGIAKEANNFIKGATGIDPLDFLSKAKSGIEEVTESATGLGEGLEGVGGAAGKAAKGVQDFASSIKDTISGQLDIFSKFETKQEVSAETMLENMRSNINGFASWSHRLAVLAERGIDQALYQKLAEMGPKGYETVAAFVQMTDEQLKEANELFATSLTLPQSQADIVTAGFTYAGEMASQGFSNALQEHDTAHAAAHGLGQAAIDGINEALEVHSPSRKTYETGVFAVKGLQMGIGDASAQALVLLYVRMLCRSVIGEFQANMKSDQFYQIGKNATLGLAQGIADSDAAAQVMARAGEIAAAAGAKMASALQEHSPSRLTRKIGKYASLGLAIGISDGAKNVIDASEAVAEEGMSGFGRLQEVLSEGIDFKPVITPMLDLSVIRSQISELNAMIDSNAISAEAQNGGQFTGNPTQQINFTQNNYSPKELSRYEIYRNTKNQINMMKGVVKANA